MCGRYTLVLVGPELIERFKVEPPAFVLRPKYNIAPTQQLPIITTAKPQALTEAVWGYKPTWMTKRKTGVINARAETIASKPFFKNSLNRRRCLVPADGFFEWDHRGRRRQPYRFTLKQGGLFAFAGIYEDPDPANPTSMPSYALITTGANDVVGKIHDRMPVILRRCDEQSWLDIDLPTDRALALLSSYAAGEMVAQPISSKVNSPAFDGPEVIQPLADTGHAPIRPKMK